MGYMPMEAATSGTLSTTALARPMRLTMIASLPTVLVSQPARLLRMWVCSRVATASRMPMKKTMQLKSMRLRALTRLRCSLNSSSSLLRWSSSPTSQRMPRPKRMPMNGGRWVTLLKIGTEMRVPMPMQNMKFCSNGVVS